jgi:hypothetical protein
MKDSTKKHPKITRVEVIGNGREYVQYGVSDVSVNIQDDGRTLKIFLKKENEYD